MIRGRRNQLANAVALKYEQRVVTVAFCFNKYAFVFSYFRDAIRKLGFSKHLFTTDK